ncbi:hypothetical protein ATERTT37_005046 [Aspergillus terreus]
MKLIGLLSLALLTTLALAAPDPKKNGPNRDWCGQVCTGKNDCSGECNKCVNFVCKRTSVLIYKEYLHKNATDHAARLNATRHLTIMIDETTRVDHVTVKFSVETYGMDSITRRPEA